MVTINRDLNKIYGSKAIQLSVSDLAVEFTLRKTETPEEATETEETTETTGNVTPPKNRAAPHHWPVETFGL